MFGIKSDIDNHTLSKDSIIPLYRFFGIINASATSSNLLPFSHIGSFSFFSSSIIRCTGTIFIVSILFFTATSAITLERCSTSFSQISGSITLFCSDILFTKLSGCDIHTNTSSMKSHHNFLIKFSVILFIDLVKASESKIFHLRIHCVGSICFANIVFLHSSSAKTTAFIESFHISKMAFISFILK
jgi:hypothetical protein